MTHTRPEIAQRPQRPRVDR